MGELRCELCGSSRPDIHTMLCGNCFCRLPPDARWRVEQDARLAAQLWHELVEQPVTIRWTEEQYQQHMAKANKPQEREDKKARKPDKRVKIVGQLMFDLLLTPSGNEWQRMHFRARKRVMESVADQIRAQIPNASGIPFRRAKVRIIRRTSVKPDKDGLYGSVKPILDALQVKSKRHPYGASVIENDDDSIELDVTWEKAPPKHGSVVVIVTPF